MRILVLTFLLFGLKTSVFAQTIHSATTEPIGFLSKNSIVDSLDNVLYHIKGQIVFKNTSLDKNDIILTIDQRKHKTKLNEGIETKARWIIQNDEMYWRREGSDVLICTIERKGGFTSFYNVFSDSLIAYIDTDSLNSLQLAFVFFHTWNTLHLETKFEQEAQKEMATSLPEGVLGFMKPVFGDPLNVWIWDGTLFYPAYENDPFYVWSYDGSTLKPKWNSRIETEWSWDGEELKPYWGGHPRNNWRWEGNILRQVFESNYKNEYELVDGIARKRFGNFGETEWEVHGDVPLPLISSVLLEIVYRR